MGGKDIIIPSAMWPLNGKTGIVLSHDNTVPCKDDGIRSVFDGMQFTVGGCYHNAFILREALRNAGYQADTYAGWLFVGDTIPAHHCVVILNEDTVLDPTVIDYRKMALDKLDKREAVVDFLKSIENAALEEVLNRISERDRYIFFSRALHGRSFHELALELDLGYQGVAAAYHRVCKKVKEATGRDVK